MDVIKMASIRCKYNNSLGLGHEELAKFRDNSFDHFDYTFNTTDMIVLPHNESTFYIYQNENMTIKRNQQLNIDYIYINGDIVAQNNISNKNVRILTSNKYQCIPLPLEDYLWTDILSRNNRLIIHGGAAILDKTIYLYFGESGAGKSTLSSILQKSGFKIFSDERIIIDNNLKIYSSYWVSSNGIINNLSAQINKIVYLRHSKDKKNKILSVPHQKLYPCFIKQIFYPIWDKNLTARVIINATSFLRQVQCYILDFVPNDSAVQFMFDNIYL